MNDLTHEIAEKLGAGQDTKRAASYVDAWEAMLKRACQDDEELAELVELRHESAEKLPERYRPLARRFPLNRHQGFWGSALLLAVLKAEAGADTLLEFFASELDDEDRPWMDSVDRLADQVLPEIEERFRAWREQTRSRLPESPGDSTVSNYLIERGRQDTEEK